MAGSTMKVGKQRDNLTMRAGEVRQMLGIGKNTLYEWCRQGIIPHKRIGRLIFFSRRVIQDFLENKMEGGMK